MSRLEFTAKVKRAAFQRSAGYCECGLVPELRRPGYGCGTKLAEGRIRYEHIIQDAIAHDNSLGNCAVLSIGCWREKTDKHDLPTIAKSNRVRDRSWGIKRRRSRPMPHGRGSRTKRKITGEVVPR